MSHRVESLIVGPFAVNCYLLAAGDGSCAVIDPGDEPEEIFAVIEELGLRPVRVINTHGHFDHTGAVDAICDRYGLPVMVHEADAEAIGGGAAYFGLSGLDAKPDAEITVLRDGERIDLSGEEIVVMHTPGHTPGSICLHCGDDLFSGDTLFARSIGRTDLPGGDSGAMADSLRRLAALPPETRVLPGHMGESTIRDELMLNPYLRELELSG